MRPAFANLPKIMSSKNTSIEAAVIEFYRKEIRQRYQLLRLRELEEFDGVPDDMLKALRDFFLERLYPPKDERDKVFAALDELGHMLRSPKRLTPLVRAALTSLLRLGAQLPAAVSAGITAVDALRETRKLETAMMDVARKLDLTPENAADRHTMLRVIAGVPEDTVRRLIQDVISLFEALSNVKMLSGMLRIMERSLNVMEARPETYSPTERDAVAIGLEVIRGGHDLFLRIKPQDFPRIIKGIEKIELAWYDNVRQEVEQDPAAE